MRRAGAGGARFAIVLHAAAAALALCAGCDDEVATSHPVGVSLPEGGNLIFEYLHLDSKLQATYGLPQGVTTLERTIAYFANHMTPEANAKPLPGQCNNLDATMGWPMYIGSPNIQLDVGTLTITGSNAAGEPISLAVPQMPAGIDALGRSRDIYYQDISPIAARYIEPDSSFDVTFGGAGSIQSTTLTGALYMPASFDVIDPSLEGAPPLFGGTDPADDYWVHWVPAMSNLPSDRNYASGHLGGVAGLVWLADMNGSPVFLCVAVHSDGQFAITSDKIKAYAAVAYTRGTDPTHAILVRSALVHILVRLPNGDRNNPRDIDMLSMVSWAQVVEVRSSSPRSHWRPG